MGKVYQEFYCATSGSGCGGYITVKLNMALNHKVIVRCPNCKHEHHRVIKDGMLYDHGGDLGGYTEEIIPPRSAFHKEPIVSGHSDRNAKKLDNSVKPRSGMLGLWFERFGGRV